MTYWLKAFSILLHFIIWSTALYKNSEPWKKPCNTRDIMSYFFRYVWYRQSAADTSLAFRATRFRWWMNGEAFTILNPRSFLTEFFGITAAKTLKNPYHLQTVTIKLLKKGKKTKIRKEKPKAIRIQWLWWRHFSRLRTKTDNWKIFHRPILTVYLKDFFCR